ncbi:MAG TPA: histidine kinase [Blastocatellia bacterium]|nr:histidine kinase [Blastocatellia bacterium]
MMADYIQHLQQELAADPDNISLQMDLGRAYYGIAVDRRGASYADAQRIFEKILQRDPNNPRALAYHGALLGLEIGNNLIPKRQISAASRQATTELDKAVALGPDIVEVREMRGFYYYYTPSAYGRDALAIGDFTQAIKLLESQQSSEESRAELYLALGDAYRKTDDRANAEANWRKTATILPGSALADAAKARLASSNDYQDTSSSTHVRDLTALFGFLIGTVIFLILTFLLLRDLLYMRGRRGRVVISLIISGAVLVWNALNLAAVIVGTVSVAQHPVFKQLSVLGRNNLFLVIALSPIPFALIVAYRVYKATFMDIVLKRGLGLLAILVVSSVYARLVKIPLFLTINQAPSDVVRSIYYSGIWLWLYLLYPPLTVWINKGVDRYLFKRRNYSNLLDWFNDQVGSATDEESLLRVCSEALKEAFATDSVCHLPDSEPFAAKLTKAIVERNSPVMLRREFSDEALYKELEIRNAELVLAIKSGNDVLAIFLIAPRLFGLGYLSEELSVLRSLSSQIGRTLENLRLHEARRQQAIAEEELRRLTALAELKALRAQIDPHFFFNALNSVSSLISDSPEAAEELLQNISDLFRQSFKQSREFVSLEQELSLIDTYMKVERVRLGSKLLFIKEILPDALYAKVPALCIQPLIENAVKHGIGRSNRGGKIILTTKIVDRRLNVTVTDSGVGISPSALPDILSRGVGLANVNDRLVALYGPDSALQIESQAGHGTKVSFEIPLAEFRSHVLQAS